MSFSDLISVAIFAALLVRVTCAQYYPDIVYEIGTSCSEKAIFATTKDPFYQWITRSYLVDGFESNGYITIQEAGTSYKKLSEWRVADSSSAGPVKMFNSPEPHVIGGSFREHPGNLIARMTVNWGLSIRICLGSIFGDEGQNMCRYTGQVIAVEKENGISFNMLLSKKYFNNTDQKVSYLTNWVSNARVPGAVGENRTILGQNETEFWYYSNPLLEKSCGSSKQYIYYSPDMAAYLGDSYEKCLCVGNVCVQEISSFQVENGEFSKSSPCNNQSVKSYWIPLNKGVYLYSYSSKFDAYYSLNSTFSTSVFPGDVNDTTVNAMESFSSCFEGWLDDQHADPVLTNLTSLSQSACISGLINWTFRMCKYPNVIIATDMSAALSSVEKAVENGDNCHETSKEETVCSSDILTKLEKQGIESIISNFSQIKDVKAYAKSQWEELGTKRHDAYVDIVTAILAFFSATVAVFSHTLVQMEHKVVSCYRWVSKQCICRQGKTKAEQVYLDEQSIQQKEQLRPQVHKDESKPQVQSSLAVRFVRFFIRFAVLGGVMGQFAYTAWDTLHKLKSGPDVAWTQTIEYRHLQAWLFLSPLLLPVTLHPNGLICMSWEL